MTKEKEFVVLFVCAMSRAQDISSRTNPNDAGPAGRESAFELSSGNPSEVWNKATPIFPFALRTPVTRTERRSAYTASKRGLVGLVQSAALDYASKGIRVNVLIPGTTDTELARRPFLYSTMKT